jgi:hypothetical protein
MEHELIELGEEEIKKKRRKKRWSRRRRRMRRKKSTRESKKLSALLFFQFIYTKVGVEQVRALGPAVHKLAYSLHEEGFRLVAQPFMHCMNFFFVGDPGCFRSILCLLDSGS